MTYYAIYKPTQRRYDIPESAHGTMFRLIEHWAAMGRDRAMKEFREKGKIETRHVVFYRCDQHAGGPCLRWYDPATETRRVQ